MLNTEYSRDDANPFHKGSTVELGSRFVLPLSDLHVTYLFNRFSFEFILASSRVSSLQYGYRGGSRSHCAPPARAEKPLLLA